VIGYVNLGTNDLPRAAKFYDALLAVIGAKRFMEMERNIAWSNGGAGLVICKPFDGEAATVGNGVMVALAAGNQQNVDALYRKALELGGKDEGPPGPRGTSGFYAAYFRDLDGNKLCAFHVG
jgi:catechol 2,3-dioxygenase-like lactoylglutathione lyase family enzyme